MIMIIVSIILDGLFSNFSNIFFPLLTLTSLIIGYKKKDKFINYAIMAGMLYGILFTKMFLLELISYYICLNFILFFFKNINYNLCNCIILTILNITLYRVVNFIILSSCKVINFNIFLLFKSIYSSLLLNVIYIFILYFMFNGKSNKKKYILYN